MKTPDPATDILLRDMCERENGPFTQQEIADYAGCSRRYIRNIEDRAMAKLAMRLKQDFPDILSDLADGN